MADRSTDTNNNIDAFAFLSSKVRLGNSLNLQNFNIIIENIFRDILNLIYDDRTFSNLNAAVNNSTAIDLVDDKNELAIQVTSTTNIEKAKTTIEKYNKKNGYEKLIMLYCVDKKPDRRKAISSNKIVIEEWDLSDLLTKINDSESNVHEKISELIRKDIMPALVAEKTNEDESAILAWDGTKHDDPRNITAKLKDACNTITKARIDKYCRDIASGKSELQNQSDRYVSAMKFRIFEVCQDELIEFCESKKKSELTREEIKDLINRYTNKAVEIIKDKSKDYSYVLKSEDILRKLVLALIDECYLSFDEKGIYNE